MNQQIVASPRSKVNAIIRLTSQLQAAYAAGREVGGLLRQLQNLYNSTVGKTAVVSSQISSTPATRVVPVTVVTSTTNRRRRRGKRSAVVTAPQTTARILRQPSLPMPYTDFSNVEYIVNPPVTEGGGFQQKEYPVNDSLLPILQGMATHFQRYQIVAMSFEYVTRTTTSDKGTTGLYLVYGDPSKFRNMTFQMALSQSVSGPLWEDTGRIVQRLDTSRLQHPVLIHGGEGGNDDEHESTAAWLYWWLDSIATVTEYGMLKVSYRVRFMEPRLLPTGTGAARVELEDDEDQSGSHK